MGRKDKRHFQNKRKLFQKEPRPPPFKPQRHNIVHNSLREDEIGITEYITSTEGFTGIIKHRISDFHVNEIGFDGKICILNDFTIPRPPENVMEKPATPAEFIELISQEKYNEIQKIEVADKKCNDSVLIEVTSMEKDKRTQIHHTIKEVFHTIASATVDENDKKFIKCSKQNKKNDRRSKWVWPNEYVYFMLHKDNIDTMQAVSGMAPLLNGARASAITYAGTKDKRARTTQWVCVRRREPILMVKAAQRLRNMFVGNFQFHDLPLKLGQLQGNRFRIALRQITAAEDKINNSLEIFKENGFINYYGHQRFGNHASVPTHQIGLLLVRGDFKTACEWILKPRENDFPEMQTAREHWWINRDADEALNLMQRHDRGGRSIEYKLLAGLAKNGRNDYVNSLENVPRNVRLMYIHAFQSLIWNEMVSRRIAMFGIQLCEGDLIFVDSTDSNTEVLDEDIICDEEATEGFEPPSEKAEKVDEAEEAKNDLTHFQTMVRPLTKDDIESNKYTIFDILLPLPGHDVTYPANECAEWYEERLKKENLSSEKLKQKQKTYSLCGAYRKVFVKPIDLHWYFMNYHNDTDTLLRSDVEELRGEPEPKSSVDGPQKALIVEFSLPSSSYATMALREVLKCDTSVANQVQLAQKHIESIKRSNENIANDEFENKKAKIELKE